MLEPLLLQMFLFFFELKCTSESSPQGHGLINKLPCVPFCALLCLLVFQCEKVTVVQGLPGRGCSHASLKHFRPKLPTGKRKKEDKSSSVPRVPAHPIWAARCWRTVSTSAARQVAWIKEWPDVSHNITEVWSIGSVKELRWNCKLPLVTNIVPYKGLRVLRRSCDGGCEKYYEWNTGRWENKSIYAAYLR